MADKKQASKKKTSKQEAGPQASRPYMPGYGVPKDKKGLLPWSHVSERMNEAMHYWVSTVDPEGRPHSTPVDGLWIDDRLYFGGSPKTRRSRNLAENPAMCINLGNALDVVILHGEAHELSAPDSALVARLIEASNKKYGYAPRPEDFGKGGVYVFRPRKVLAWKQFPKDATRWHFEDGD
ncbi:MAG: pyridoxamine 5'-phosphate oxidase family protein [Blastocatellia bacterium]|nr:pyridoxamine 5'-phosphate oxidase family protein [Blastocatellia bacterium]